MSGAEAAPGAWPALADRLSVSAAEPTRMAAMIAWRFIWVSPSIGSPRGKRPMRERTIRSLRVRRERRPRRRTPDERQPHGRDLLVLIDDDLLRDAAQLLALPVAQLGFRHVDRALVVRDHHGCKVAVNIARRADIHSGHHGAHGRPIFRHEQIFGGLGRQSSNGGKYDPCCRQSKAPTPASGGKHTNPPAKTYLSFR